MDNHVLEFLKLISPRISNKKIKILLKSEYFDKKRSSSVNQVVDMFRETFPEIYLKFLSPTEMNNSGISNIKNLQQLDNKMQHICFPIDSEFKIPIIMEILTIPRQDGKQRVMLLSFFRNQELELAQKTLDTIMQVQIYIVHLTS
jgi:hypothetical protein